MVSRSTNVTNQRKMLKGFSIFFSFGIKEVPTNPQHAHCHTS